MWNTNWLGPGDPCDPALPWYGVGCAAVTDATLPNISAGAPFGVTALQLAANNLTGVVPTNLAAVFGPTLQLLDLADNFITGALPSAIFSMERLHSIFLYGRGKTSIPNNPPLLYVQHTFFFFFSLLSFDLGGRGGGVFCERDEKLSLHNVLSRDCTCYYYFCFFKLMLTTVDNLCDVVLRHGSLPEPPCTANLKYLHLQRQNLTGSIPASIGNVCTSLNQVIMFENGLTGTPKCLFFLSRNEKS